jgi:hypothetical protein
MMLVILMQLGRGGVGEGDDGGESESGSEVDDGSGSD